MLSHYNLVANLAQGDHPALYDLETKGNSCRFASGHSSGVFQMGDDTQY
jgi:hypothetical protein